MFGKNTVESTDSSITKNQGLQIEESLIFEQGSTTRTGVDLPEPMGKPDRLGGLGRTKPIGLPGLSEPETVRHYTRLSRNNYAIDIGLYPLGSCTMKHNPRLNEKLARLPGFSDIHPLQPVSTVQGALLLITELTDWLTKLTGFPTIAMSPAAGAQGELCGLMTIRSYLEHQGNPRKIVLVADSAHGTNPATATMCGYQARALEIAPHVSARAGRPGPRSKEAAATTRCRAGGEIAGGAAKVRLWWTIALALARRFLFVRG